MTSQLRGCISADVRDLNALHAQHPWLPNEHTIRPTPEVLEEKRRSMEEVERHWLSINKILVAFDFLATLKYFKLFQLQMRIISGLTLLAILNNNLLSILLVSLYELRNEHSS